MKSSTNFRKIFIYILSLALYLSITSYDAFASNSSTDSNAVNIRSFHEYFYIKGISSQKRFGFDFEDLNNPGYKMDFRPNIGSYLGLGIFIFDFGIDILFRTPPTPEENALKGNSKGRDWQIHMYTRKVGIDISYQKYLGFYLSNPDNFFPEWQEGDPYPTQEDMEATIFNLGVTYVFTSDRFSFPSIFNQTEAQLKSGGSWLLSGQANSSKISHPLSIIPMVDTNNFTGLNNLNKVNVSSLNIMPGYSHNFIIKKKIYLNLSLALGLGYQIRSYTADQSYNDNSINIANTWRIGAGYNGRRFFTGISAYTQNNVIVIQNLRINSTFGFIRFFIGYRFREWGVMQKSVFDLFNLFSKKKRDK